MSPYIIAIGVAWLAAQGAKYVVASIKDKTFRRFRQLYLSGNMPSAHSATTVAMATVVGLRHGMESAIFGVALLFALVVMYDAVMVRRSVGEQGQAIQNLIQGTKLEVLLPRSAKGHTPLEVAVGAALGLLIGIVVYITTK